MDQADLERLLMALRRDGFRVIGPTPREGAVRLGDLESTQELPWGVGDEQEPGRYRLTSRARGAFGHTVGQDSFKRFFLAPSELLWRAERRDSKLHFTNAEPVPEKLALFGVRACDLAAIEIQDQVLLGADPRYRARREGAFVVAVSCTVSSGSCFCASMGTGPRASRGFDLALVELDRCYVVEVKSERGLELCERLGLPLASAEELAVAEEAVTENARAQSRRMSTEDLHDVLLSNLDHAHWDEVAERCLACANCTSVCPTCFCTNVKDSIDVTGSVAERWRVIDSCFTHEFTHLHGGSVRSSTRSRYRQWLTHKLATWVDQFGRSGCVGCGRCITWCPAGIEITREASALRQGRLP
ncbi:MAG: 4Fe-4S dicluster domain-containing protein [Polyangiaceae bacterium]|nr:4Fe-4S dicluster domain-containing protein [Polyangiaceae bacterium]